MSSRPELRNVEVRVRVRPGSKKSCVRTHSTKELSVDDKRWAFDRVYGPKSSQEDVYEEAVKPLVEATLDGYNSTVFAYGQTGSGKTFTMRAIFAAAAEHLFRLVDLAAGDVVTVAYAELGGSGARDMLNAGKATQMLTDAVGDVQLVPSLEVQCTTPQGLLALIEYASALRATHATGVHDASSRSHAVCRIGIQRAAHEKGQSGSLTLVDLAGSEQRECQPQPQPQPQPCP